jgi:uncharacterized membrane protein YdjX (TVP38/TMEM64 family)
MGFALMGESGGRGRRIAAALALGAGLTLAAWLWTHGEVDLDPDALRGRIAALGWMAPAAFIAVAAFRPFLAAPSWVVMAAGGLLFGTLGGMLYGVLGFSAGAFLTFGIARGLGRDAVERRLDGRLGRADSWIAERGAAWLGAYTALPVVPLTPGHAAAGLSGMRASAFGAAVVVGLIPRTALLSFLGDAFARRDWAQLGMVSALIGLTALLAIWAVRRFSPEADGNEV